jgi:DNA-binding IclR family transcriptional regulator
VTKLLALNRFLDGTARALHPSAALVWVQLLRDERGGAACAAVTDLARRCGLSPRTVKRRLAELKVRGLLSVVQPGTREAGATVYRLCPRTRREK